MAGFFARGAAKSDTQSNLVERQRQQMDHQQTSDQRRDSAETDRRHLLSSASSIAPSETTTLDPDDSASRASTIYTDGDGDRTPRAQSPQGRRSTIADPTTVPQPYKGFRSEAEYMAALRAWADEKRYLQPDDNGLVGYYGETTMEEYASRPKVEFGISKRLKARKERKAEEARRKSAV